MNQNRGGRPIPENSNSQASLQGGNQAPGSGANSARRRSHPMPAGGLNRVQEQSQHSVLLCILLAPLIILGLYLFLGILVSAGAALGG